MQRETFRPATKSRSDGLTLNAALKPLFAVAGVTFSTDLMDGFNAALKHCDPRHVRQAVEHHLDTSMERFLPAPAVIKKLALAFEVGEWRERCMNAPPCRICRGSGMVTARVRGDRQWAGVNCCCLRGERREGSRFNPVTMETEESVRRALPPRADVPRLTVEQLVAGIGGPSPSHARRKEAADGDAA